MNEKGRLVLHVYAEKKLRCSFMVRQFFGNVLGKVMASHNHIEMFVNRVARIRHRGVGATW